MQFDIRKHGRHGLLKPRHPVCVLDEGTGRFFGAGRHIRHAVKNTGQRILTSRDGDDQLELGFPLAQ
ncbi:hypothetical protein D3C76_1705950 [compost metagenome]